MVQVREVFMQHIRYLYSPEAPSGLCFMVRIFAAHSARYRTHGCTGHEVCRIRIFFGCPQRARYRALNSAGQYCMRSVDRSWSVNSAGML